MGVIEEVLAANEGYARDFKLGHLPMPPARKLAVLACMDARLTVEHMLGLKTGDAPHLSQRGRHCHRRCAALPPDFSLSARHSGVSYHQSR